MAITLDGRTIPTSEFERLFLRLGGVDSNAKSLSTDELRNALVNAIEILAAERSPILEKIYQQLASGNPALPSLDELKHNTQLADEA